MLVLFAAALLSTSCGSHTWEPSPTEPRTFQFAPTDYRYLTDTAKTPDGTYQVLVRFRITSCSAIAPGKNGRFIHVPSDEDLSIRRAGRRVWVETVVDVATRDPSKPCDETDRSSDYDMFAVIPLIWSASSSKVLVDGTCEGDFDDCEIPMMPMKVAANWLCSTGIAKTTRTPSYSTRMPSCDAFDDVKRVRSAPSVSL